MRPDVAARNSNYIGYANAVPKSLPLLDAEVRADPATYPPHELRSRFYTISARSAPMSAHAPAPRADHDGAVR